MTPTGLPFEFAPALPEMVLLGTACFVLVVDLFLSDSQRAWSYWLTQLGLLAATWLTLVTLHEQPVRALGGMFVADGISDWLKVFSYASVGLMLFYSRSYLTVRGMFRGETVVLTITSLLGVTVMISPTASSPCISA